MTDAALPPGDAPPPAVVIGTAGHIDHGKTTLLAALTGIDADRLPEERRRGMTIDVGYAHRVLPDGRTLDFVDVPGHDGLVANMLVGAGEIDAALLVVAADDGPRAQTREHLALLHGLGIGAGVVAITKADTADAARIAAVAAEIEALLAPTALAGAPAIAVSARTGAGIDALLAALAGLAARVAAQPPTARGGGVRLPVDRVFAVRGRGTVVTGSLRGGTLAAGATLQVVPGGASLRIREVQVHGASVAVAGPGRTALNVAGPGVAALARGVVCSTDPALVATDRVLVLLAPPPDLPPPATGAPRPAPWPPADGARARIHAGTAEGDATVGRAGRDAVLLPDGRAIAVIRTRAPIALAPGDRFVLRRPSPGTLLAGGRVLDPAPARGVSRRRQDPARLAALAAAVVADDPAAIAAARVALHGVRVAADGTVAIDPELRAAAAAGLRAHVAAHHAAAPAEPGIAAAALRAWIARDLRRAATLPGGAAAAAADALLAGLLADGVLVRAADRIALPEHRAAGPDPALLAAMDRLEAALGTVAPPGLAAAARAAGGPPVGLRAPERAGRIVVVAPAHAGSAAARAAGCPPDGIRALERAGRIVVVAPDLAWSAARYRELAARALVLATRGPLTPAAFRDATGTSRKYVLAILEDLDRRGILRRTDAGHLPGPKAPPLPGR